MDDRLSQQLLTTWRRSFKSLGELNKNSGAAKRIPQDSEGYLCESKQSTTNRKTSSQPTQRRCFVEFTKTLIDRRLAVKRCCDRRLIRVNFVLNLEAARRMHENDAELTETRIHTIISSRYLVSTLSHSMWGHASRVKIHQHGGALKLSMLLDDQAQWCRGANVVAGG